MNAYATLVGVLASKLAAGSCSSRHLRCTDSFLALGSGNQSCPKPTVTENKPIAFKYWSCREMGFAEER